MTLFDIRYYSSHFLVKMQSIIIEQQQILNKFYTNIKNALFVYLKSSEQWQFGGDLSLSSARRVLLTR